MSKVRPNPLKSDPTRTKTQRRALQRDINKRFNRLKDEITKLIVTDDIFGTSLDATENASSCGAGAPGSPGFQPGNTCGGKGGLSISAPDRGWASAMGGSVNRLSSSNEEKERLNSELKESKAFVEEFIQPHQESIDHSVLKDITGGGSFGSVSRYLRSGGEEAKFMKGDVDKIDSEVSKESPLAHEPKRRIL